MSIRTRTLAGALAATLTVYAAGTHGDQQAPPLKTDFAFGAAIVTTTSGPLYELPLPLDVYRHATRADLGDLRVFNAAGDVVPHGLLPGPLQAPALSTRVALSAFPFRMGAPLASSGLDVRIDQGDGSTRVIVRGGTGSTSGNRAWLVDASKQKRKPRALLLSWPASSAPFTRRIRLEGSHDLSRWQRLGAPITIADVSWSGERLLANRVAVPASRYPWYRLVTADNGGPLPEFSFEAEFAPAAHGRGQFEWLSVTTTASDEQTGELRFSTPAALPVERLRIRPAERNTYVRLRAQARGLDDAEWREAGSGSVYRLDFDNAPLLSEALTVRAPGAIEWRLLPSSEAAATGAGFGETAPTVEVGWTPRSLVFLARGEGPYLLAFASRRVTPVVTDGRRLLGNDIAIVGLPMASAAASQPLGNPERAFSSVRDVDWKQLLLWGVLVGGAALLVFLAFRLLQRSGPPPA